MARKKSAGPKTQLSHQVTASELAECRQRLRDVPDATQPLLLSYLDQGTTPLLLSYLNRVPRR